MIGDSVAVFIQDGTAVGFGIGGFGASFVWAGVLVVGDIVEVKVWIGDDWCSALGGVGDGGQNADTGCAGGGANAWADAKAEVERASGLSQGAKKFGVRAWANGAAEGEGVGDNFGADTRTVVKNRDIGCATEGESVAYSSDDESGRCVGGAAVAKIVEQAENASGQFESDAIIAQVGVLVAGREPSAGAKYEAELG